MAKYISASGMIETIEMLRWKNYLNKDASLNLLRIAVDEAPTVVVDSVEAVRCKVCKHRKNCTHTRRLGINGFCSEGE